MFSTHTKSHWAVLFLFFSSFATIAQDATNWKLDKAHTSVNFSINHFFSAVTGKFRSFEGQIHFDPNNLAGSKAEFTVAVNSISTDDEKRDKHLQSADFFDVKRFPQMSFISTRIEKKSAKDFLIFGKLTIKDHTQELVLPMRITGEMEHPMNKGLIIMGLAIDTTIDRTSYGVGTGSWAATAIVGDEVRIHIPMELNRRK